jgi:hypothetical protein
MDRYKNGKIYKIVDNTNGNVYIGSTCEPTLAHRLTKHRYDYKRFLKGGSYISSVDILKDDVNIPITFIIKTECWSAGTNIIFELIDEPLFSFKISKYASFLFHTPLFDSKSRNLSFNKVNDSIAEIWKEDVVEKLYKNFFTSEELIIKINCDEEVYLTATEFYYIVSHDINNKKRDNVEYIRE